MTFDTYRSTLTPDDVARAWTAFAAAALSGYNAAKMFEMRDGAAIDADAMTAEFIKRFGKENDK